MARPKIFIKLPSFFGVRYAVTLVYEPLFICAQRTTYTLNSKVNLRRESKLKHFIYLATATATATEQTQCQQMRYFRSFLPFAFLFRMLGILLFLCFCFEDYLYYAHSHYGFECVSFIVARHTRHNF